MYETPMYLSITDENVHFLVYKNLKIQIQTFRYGYDNVVYFVDSSIFVIE